ncbi:MAG: class II fructose-bisphosphate aldolase [Clostridiales bacterium]|nr:class II fructose-bisphosphate aldolase [Clostridiales bacterium]
MLANLNDVLPKARKNKKGVGLFNTLNTEMARGVILAAEEKNCPVIVGTAEILLPFTPLEVIADMLLPMAERASVPVVVHFDHGLQRNECIRALQLGFSSIMYDCSTVPYDENRDRVREMTAIAHAYRATIEAELGHVGDNDGNEDPASFYTDPVQAREYSEYTGIDALAIAVGTAHGAYKLPPRLDFGRIREIASIIDTPLVLHGGSGLSDEDFRMAISEGISKVNIFTDINLAYAKAAKEELNIGHCSAAEMMQGLTGAVKEETEKKMTLFGW